MDKRNSLVILVVYSQNGILDKYIEYLGNKIKECCKDLFIVINGTMDKGGIGVLNQIADAVYIRQNIGYDCGAYKQALIEYIGWNSIVVYDEIILLNDSCFGPIYPLEKVFAKMDSQNCDFWGITEQPVIKAGNFTETKLPYHIQTYFLCIKKNMFNTKEFRDFWESLQLCDGYMDTVYNFELKFTKHFNNLGFVSSVYVNSKKMCVSENETQAYVFFDSFRLIKEEKCPFLKKKVFSFPQKDILASNHGEIAKKTIDYIDKYTEYSSKLIYESLIRNNNAIDLWIKLHLDFFYSETSMDLKNENDDTAIVFFDNEHGNEYISYLQNMFLFKEDSSNRFKELVDFLNGYKYIGFISERALSAKITTLESKVSDVMKVFESQPYVGMLADISLLDEKVQVKDYYTDNRKSKYIAEEIGIDVQVDCEIVNFSYSRNVWFRKEVIIEFLRNERFCNAILECYVKNNKEYECLPLLYPYLAQCKGYYAGRLINNNDFNIQIDYYKKMLSGMIRENLLYRGIKEFRNVRRVHKNLIDFCRSNKDIYIYGAGDIANECLAHLKMNGVEVLGFVVSDGKRTDLYCSGLRILELSELGITDDVGIVIGANKLNCEVIKKNLNSKNITNIILYEE